MKLTIKPSFDNISEWALNGVTYDFMIKSLEIGIHPIHWVRPEIITELLDNYTLRFAFSKDGVYYKPNYGNVSYKAFEKYPFLFFCRGDVLKVGSDFIVAKVFNKFWNVNETSITLEANLPWYGGFACTEKMDGMLIVPYRDDKGEWHLTSRGSFDFEVIPVAESYFNNKYKYFCDEYHNRGLHPVFEIISEESFIKVQYSKEQYGLYFLGCVGINGEEPNYIDEIMEDAESFGLKVPKIHIFDTKEDAMVYINHFDKYYDFEGFAVRFNMTGDIVKIKADKYMEVNLQNINNIESLYDWWVTGQIDDVVAGLPPIKQEGVLKMIELFKSYNDSLLVLYRSHEHMIEDMVLLKDVVEYFQRYVDKKYFSFFINMYKNNAMAVKKTIRTITIDALKDQKNS